jgi:hypothetical protein
MYAIAFNLFDCTIGLWSPDFDDMRVARISGKRTRREDQL